METIHSLKNAGALLLLWKKMTSWMRRFRKHRARQNRYIDSRHAINTQEHVLFSSSITSIARIIAIFTTSMLVFVPHSAATLDVPVNFSSFVRISRPRRYCHLFSSYRRSILTSTNFPRFSVCLHCFPYSSPPRLLRSCAQFFATF